MVARRICALTVLLLTALTLAVRVDEEEGQTGVITTSHKCNERPGRPVVVQLSTGDIPKVQKQKCKCVGSVCEWKEIPNVSPICSFAYEHQLGRHCTPELARKGGQISESYKQVGSCSSQVLGKMLRCEGGFLQDTGGRHFVTANREPKYDLSGEKAACQMLCHNDPSPPAICEEGSAFLKLCDDDDEELEWELEEDTDGEELEWELDETDDA